MELENITFSYRQLYEQVTEIIVGIYYFRKQNTRTKILWIAEK